MKPGQSFRDAHGWVKILSIHGVWVVVRRKRQEPFISHKKYIQQIIDIRNK